MVEKEYIEREKAFDAVFGQFCASSDETEAALNAAIEEIRAIPAADVRPVVLCKDCRYAYDSVGGWCCSHGVCVDCIVREDFFCADSEKKEG